MLFIDEAEAFVGTRARANQSEHLRNAFKCDSISHWCAIAKIHDGADK